MIDYFSQTNTDYINMYVKLVFYNFAYFFREGSLALLEDIQERPGREN